RCKYKQETFYGKLYVIDKKVDTIMGRDWLREVKLNWHEIKSLKIQTNMGLDELLSEFKDIFRSEIGAIPSYRGQLRLKENSKPIFVKPRIVPFALKKKVEEELRRLEGAGIITKIENLV
ncbi:hypothetical protein, partial [Klebsiella pneumoniae]|uniref:hypothetical protein n=1 Tax=Klebsiella pneumoniae TaxID=573 RepID=UPI0040553D4C